MTDKKLTGIIARRFREELLTFKGYKCGEALPEGKRETAMTEFCKGCSERMIRALKAEGYAIGEDADKE
jgi:hypothetical protein